MSESSSHTPHIVVHDDEDECVIVAGIVSEPEAETCEAPNEASVADGGVIETAAGSAAGEATETATGAVAQEEVQAATETVAQEVAQETPRADAQVNDEQHKQLRENLEIAPMPLAQKITIVVAVLLCVVALVYCVQSFM